MTLPFETYYINMKKDKSRNDHTINTLNQTNLNYKRFEAIDGSQCKDTDYYKKKQIFFVNYFRQTK
uniref:Glycosyl transferase family 25 domain-containing protein n=1 Tax=Florenciella sp. virus SA2 TaxID=3240092 RepID=A0AB39JBA5_9VIRU